MDELKKKDLEITREVRELLARENKHIGDDEALALIKRKAIEVAPEISSRDLAKICKTVFARLRKNLSVLDDLAADDDVNEIMVIGKDNIFAERGGSIERTGLYFEDEEELNEIVRRIASEVHREINELRPILDARLADGSRVNAVYGNISLKGTALTIRKFPKAHITMDDLLGFGTLTEEAAEFLRSLVRARYNIFISGGTSTGKTTFLNALSNYIPPEERIITIEDSAELKIDGIENLVALECRKGRNEGDGIEMQDLIKTSLRMRPDRIIVGEVRGKEVIDMIQAMNTGHDGSLSTGHANSAKAMLSRLEAMFLQASDFPIKAVRSQIAEGIDIIVHLSRLASKRRIVSEISEVLGFFEGEIALKKLYEYDINGGLKKTGNELANRKKMEML
jgi:pilus assembly protein CpaF